MKNINMPGIIKLYGDIYKDIKKGRDSKMQDAEIGDAIIMASYRQVPLDKLIRIQFLLGKIIKEKKELLRKMEAEKNGRDKSGENQQDAGAGADGAASDHPACDPDTSEAH